MRNLRSLIGIFISIGLLVALAASPAFAQPRFDPPGLERAIEAQEQHTDALLANPRVVGTAVGVGAKGGAVVKIYTEKEGVAGLPRSLDGVPVVVKVTGKIQALHHRPGHGGGPSGGGNGGGKVLDPTSRFDRPVPIGTSSGTERLIRVNSQFFCTTGTLGARVNGTSGVYALSNAHVYAQEGSTTVDETGQEEPAHDDDAILQPGRADVGCALRLDDQIGGLSAWEQIMFPASACDPAQGASDPDCNVMDAAIALTDTTKVDTTTPPDGYGTPSSMTISAFVGQAVQKYGRTTSLTLGTVDSINATVDVEYDNGIARFVGQIIFVGTNGPFSDSGDSGSLIVTQGDNKPVALLFAGNSIITVGNPIDIVLAWFAVTIDGEAEINSPPTAFTLSADGFKVKGLQKVNLTWNGATSDDVDIYRDGAWIATTGNPGDYRDNIDERGGGTYSYQACESGTLPPICSTTKTVIF